MKTVWREVRVWVKPKRGSYAHKKYGVRGVSGALQYVDGASSVSSAVASVAKSHGYKKSELAGKLWKHSKRNPKTGMLTFTHVGWGTMKKPEARTYHTIKNRRRGET